MSCTIQSTVTLRTEPCTGYPPTTYLCYSMAQYIPRDNCLVCSVLCQSIHCHTAHRALHRLPTHPPLTYVTVWPSISQETSVWFAVSCASQSTVALPTKPCTGYPPNTYLCYNLTQYIPRDNCLVCSVLYQSIHCPQSLAQATHSPTTYLCYSPAQYIPWDNCLVCSVLYQSIHRHTGYRALHRLPTHHLLMLQSGPVYPKRQVFGLQCPVPVNPLSHCPCLQRQAEMRYTSSKYCKKNGGKNSPSHLL